MLELVIIMKVSDFKTTCCVRRCSHRIIKHPIDLMVNIEYSVLYTGLQLIRVEYMITTTGHYFFFAVL
jgi:hypothetical protein